METNLIGKTAKICKDASEVNGDIGEICAVTFKGQILLLTLLLKDGRLITFTERDVQIDQGIPSS